MSSQRGNAHRSRPQKYQNQKVYKKDLYGTTAVTKQLDSLRIEGLCGHCTKVIEWKIKFKKYKKLTAPGTCAKCLGKTVKEAYHTICRPCAVAAEKCPKCCQPHNTSTDAASSTQPASTGGHASSPPAHPGGKSSGNSNSPLNNSTTASVSDADEDSSNYSGSEEDESEG